MNKDRDYSIDFFKGITVVSIIFIHTVWWSGQSYVPNIVAQFSLLVDVPLFFFLSGASANFSFHKKTVFSGVIRLIVLFTLFFAVYAYLYMPNDILKNITKSIFLQFPWAPEAKIVSGSTWFIPIFVVVYFISYLIISHLGKNKIIPIICILLLYLMYKYETIETFKELKILSLTPDYVFSNLFFFLFGFYYYKKIRLSKNVKWLALILVLVSSSLLICHFIDIPFNLQSLKFPHRFYYVVASIISISITMLLSGLIKKEYFFNYLGKNALQFYLAEGIGSGLLLVILPKIQLQWPLKLSIAFVLNFIMTFIFAIAIKYILKYYILGSTKLLDYIDNFDLSQFLTKLKRRK